MAADNDNEYRDRDFLKKEAKMAGVSLVGIVNDSKTRRVFEAAREDGVPLDLTIQECRAYVNADRAIAAKDREREAQRLYGQAQNFREEADYVPTNWDAVIIIVITLGVAAVGFRSGARLGELISKPPTFSQIIYGVDPSVYMRI